ncbi:MAG: 50S ribosomal protein L28 [Thermomicrobiales bacterium]
MAGVCAISGRKTAFGRNVSHSKRRTNRRFEPNVQSHRIFVPELGAHVRLSLSTHALRVIDRKGLSAYLRDEGLTLAAILPGPQRRQLQAAQAGKAAGQ